MRKVSAPPLISFSRNNGEQRQKERAWIGIRKHDPRVTDKVLFNQWIICQNLYGFKKEMYFTFLIFFRVVSRSNTVKFCSSWGLFYSLKNGKIPPTTMAKYNTIRTPSFQNEIHPIKKKKKRSEVHYIQDCLNIKESASKKCHTRTQVTHSPLQVPMQSAFKFYPSIILSV